MARILLSIGLGGFFAIKICHRQTIVGDDSWSRRNAHAFTSRKVAIEAFLAGGIVIRSSSSEISALVATNP
jgi:hypothetical protein